MLLLKHQKLSPNSQKLSPISKITICHDYVGVEFSLHFRLISLLAHREQNEYTDIMLGYLTLNLVDIVKPWRRSGGHIDEICLVPCFRPIYGTCLLIDRLPGSLNGRLAASPVPL